MKRKTWIVSALMYALVFLVCFGVLHVFKKITNAGDGAEYTTEAAADTDIIIDGSGVDADRGNDPENGKMAEMQKQNCQKMQTGWRQKMMGEKMPISAVKPAIKAGKRP